MITTRAGVRPTLTGRQIERNLLVRVAFLPGLTPDRADTPAQRRFSNQIGSRV